MSVSVLILTKNEALDIGDCIRSVAWSDDVHVLDSDSTDATREIAEELGAKVRIRSFDNYASQRNSGLHETEFRHEWVLILDADERVPGELRDEIASFVSAPMEGACAGRIRRRDHFWGRWLKHAQLSPFYVRLVRPSKVRYEREVNEVLRVEGRIHDMSTWFDHHPFSKGMAHWVDKHNVYSTMEARLIFEGKKATAFRFSELFARDFNARRGAQKAFFYRLPGRPLIKWLYLMIFRGSFLDGRAGITYVNLQTIYEYLIVLKTREMEAEARKGSVPTVL